MIVVRLDEMTNNDCSLAHGAAYCDCGKNCTLVTEEMMRPVLHAPPPPPPEMREPREEAEEETTKRGAEWVDFYL